MRVRLPLLTLASLFCMGASAKPVVEKSIENNLRWDGAYVVCKGDSVTYRYVDDETGELISLRDASFDTGYDIGFYVNHENGASEFVHENPYTFFPSEGDQVGYTDLEFLNGKYVTDDFLTSTDKYKMATYGGWQNVWVSETEPLYITNSSCYQLIKDGQVISDNNSINPSGGLDIKGEYNTLRVFDGTTLRTYSLDTDFALIQNSNTICKGNSAVISIKCGTKEFNGIDAYVSSNENVDIPRFDFYDITPGNDGITNLYFKELPVGNYSINLSIGTYTHTEDFVQKGFYSFERNIVVKDCEPKCKELYPVRLFASQRNVCLGDSVYIGLSRWKDVKLDAEQSETYINYTIYRNDNIDGDSISNAFTNDSTHLIKMNKTGRNIFRVFRTDNCGNIFEDTICINVTDCETGCSEPELSEDVRLLINGCHCNDTICYREGTVIRIENWDKIQEESNGNVNYTLEIQPDGIKVNLTDNYWGDSLDAGFHYFNVVRTDACGRESRDSLFLFVRPQLPHVQVTTAETISEGEDIIVRIDNWKELQNLEPYISYYVSLDGRTYSFYNDTCHIKSSEIRPSNDGYCKFTVNGGSYCNYETIEMVVKVEEAEKECPKDTVHIKPISFDIVQNGVCDFSLVYTLKDKDGCELFYAIDLDMDDCSGDDGNGVINLTVDGSYIYFDEETKVSIFSIDGRKMFDGKYKSVKLKSGIYIITTANAYRKVFIK